jgi:F-type H+-transporting ATPase subunit b
MNFLRIFTRWTTVLAVVAIVSWCLSAARAEDKPAGGTTAEAPADKDKDHAKHGDSSHADASGHGGGHGNSDPLSVDPDLAIWTFIVFVVLFAVLGKFAWGPIAAGLDLREQRIADNIAAAQASQEEAKRLLADYKRKLAAAQDEVRAIIDEARRDAEKTQQEILAKAREDSAAEIARGKHEIETATAAALKQLAEESANLAVNLAGKIISSKLSASEHSQLISEAMSKFAKHGPSHN